MSFIATDEAGSAQWCSTSKSNFYFSSRQQFQF